MRRCCGLISLGLIAVSCAPAQVDSFSIVRDEVDRHWFESPRGEHFLALERCEFETTTISFDQIDGNPCLAALHPDFEDMVCDELVNLSPIENVMGVFVGHELPWFGLHAWPDNPELTLLEEAYRTGLDNPVRQAALDFLISRHASVEAFNAAWNGEIETWDEIDLRLLRHRETEATQEDREAFTAHVAEAFYSRAVPVIREAIPGALLLGSQFAQSAPESVIRACGQHCDVVSFSEFRFIDPQTPSDELLARAWVWGGERPVLISGFGWRVRGEGFDPFGLGGVADSPEHRATLCSEYLEELLAWPMVVGAQWHGMRDAQVNEVLQQFAARANELHRQSTRNAPAEIPSLRGVGYVLDLSDDPPPVLELLAEVPIAESEVFGPPTASFDLVWGDGELTVELDTGSSMWAGGFVLFGPARLRTGRGLATDLRGFTDLVFEATVPNDMEFGVTIDEGRIGPRGDVYEPITGIDDGESFEWNGLIGTGESTTYRLSLTDFERRTGWGNQQGARQIDMHSMKGIALHFTQGQGTGTARFTSVRLERCDETNPTIAQENENQ